MAGVLAALVFFTACDMPSGGYWEYAFRNETSCTITVTLDRSYKTSTKEGTETDSGLLLYSKSSRTVYVKNGSVGFEWTADYPTDYQKYFYMYPETDGSKVTFKEQLKEWME
jgi:hypothetical protein